MSKMGTIDRITDSLKKSRSDKISLIDNRYNEHKAWMAEEFQNVRNLIAHNSGTRGKKAATAAKTSSDIVSKSVAISAAVASSSSTKSTRHIATAADPPVVRAAQRAAPAEKMAPKVVKAETKIVEEVKKNKRKSPEEALQPEKLSPEAKRNSSDFEKIVLQAGLPSDLNRLKKDSLLKELAARGHFDLSMKSLKKDMVEALKTVLLEQGKASPEKIEAVETEEEEEEDAAVEKMSESSQSLRELNEASPSNKGAAATAPASARKGSSTMSDIRKEFSSSGNVSVPVESEEERKKRTEEEFKRRLSHTQARKSEGQASVAETSDASAVEEAQDEPVKAVTPTPAPAAGRDSDIMMSEDGSTWMEVASPQPVRSLANLKTNISAETSAMTTPSHKGVAPVFIKQEKGASPEANSHVSGTSAVKMGTMPESATKLSKTQSHWERLTSASATSQEAPTASAVAAAVPPPAPTPGKDTNAAQASSAVKSSAKKGLFSFLSAKVKEEKVDPPAAPVSAVPSTPQTKSQTTAAPSSALRSGAKMAQESVLQPVQQVSKSPQQQGADEYKIEDREDSGGSDSGTDDEDENKSKQNRIPEWARGVQLKEQLERQYGLHGHASMDPDLIFPEVVSCSLEEIFGASMGKSGTYNKRGSSAHWDADELTLVEKRTYRAQMGLSVN